MAVLDKKFRLSDKTELQVKRAQIKETRIIQNTHARIILFIDFFLSQQNLMSDCAQLSEWAQFLAAIDGFSKEEQSERIHKEFGEKPEISEMLKKHLEKKHSNLDELKRIYDSWKNQGQVKKKNTSENLTHHH
jgi:hypothetical protein